MKTRIYAALAVKGLKIIDIQNCAKIVDLGISADVSFSRYRPVINNHSVLVKSIKHADFKVDCFPLNPHWHVHSNTHGLQSDLYTREGP